MVARRQWITFQSDRDGDEQWDLFAVPTETGEMRNLTRTPRDFRRISTLVAGW